LKLKNYTVKRYESKYFSDWNAFISTAKNATFLFNRDFMEYHSDRFEDFSLMIFQEDKLVCVLPANRVGASIYSHQGLTYGGMVYNNKIKLISVVEILKNILKFLHDSNIIKLQIKIIPSIYHELPAEELNYALFLAEAQLIRRDSLSVVDLSKSYSLSKDRKIGIKKGIKNKLEIKEVDDFNEFWNQILIPNLELKYQTKPVHSLKEITQLKALFNKNIRQFNIYDNGLIVAGCTIFESKTVAHSQYISSKQDKKELGGIDLLHHYLLTETFKEKLFFDFGNSNESLGKKLNKGLVYWKESFGARTITHDYYEVETLNYIKLNNFII